MKQTRNITIRDRVFSLNDLKRIAEIFDSQSKLARKSAHGAMSKYVIKFSDYTSVESDSIEILDENVLNGPGRPVAVDFRFHNFALSRSLSFEIRHGNSSYSNIASVSSEEGAWVKNNFTLLEKAIETARPQSFWFRRHPTLLFNLIALGLGSLIVLAMTLILNHLAAVSGFLKTIKPLPQDSPWRLLVAAYPAVPYAMLWVCRWFAGSSGAFGIRSWLLGLWPEIEFDLGVEHLKIEKLKRKRLIVVFTLIILPILTNIIYDMLKWAS